MKGITKGSNSNKYKRGMAVGAQWWRNGDFCGFGELCPLGIVRKMS